jgi:hypothetical protein
MFFQTNLGSFKLLNGEGRVEFSFSGTVLLSHVEGKIEPRGNLRQEFNDRNRRAYFGTGTIVVEGKFRAIQWFGSNMKGQWHGRGIARLIGEYDKNLETGYYWYASSGDKRPWYNVATEFVLPEDERTRRPVPIDRAELRRLRGR